MDPAFVNDHLLEVGTRIVVLSLPGTGMLLLVLPEQVLWWAVSWLNADVEERREEREEKQAVSLQPA